MENEKKELQKQLDKEKAKVAALHTEKSTVWACEQDVVQHSSNAECPEESFLIADGFKIEVSADTENNVPDVPDDIRKDALFRLGNQRGEENSGENCQRPRKRSRTWQSSVQVTKRVIVLPFLQN